MKAKSIFVIQRKGWKREWYDDRYTKINHSPDGKAMRAELKRVRNMGADSDRKLLRLINRVTVETEVVLKGV